MRHPAHWNRRGLFTALAGLGLLTACAGTAAETGADAPRAAVDAYVQALNARDTAAMQRLAPPGNDATEDVRRRIEDDGGQDIRLVGADISSELSPDVAAARLSGTGSAGEYVERLTLTRQDDRWYVVLGQAGQDPAKRPAATTPG
ncbi:hypothetical protein [Actinokineospora sp. NBRC 105648]|uniref:hypothetical protein n=1 Tax=Actinokineospora sp. NBRC 105648 TaxID=3032206 RepID=UPI0025549597|nr:hypothetical protein [Actinokineospora sp. NBRC 105648]